MTDADLERLARLISDTTAARGVDVYAVEVCGLSATAWADMTGRDPSTVSRNVRRARAD
jgi:DNA-directed RNA polymerase specialized sigma24 family protein